MQLDLENIQAVIFDMDGTMIDNSKYHKEAWLEFCKRHNILLSEEDYMQKISGKRNDSIFEILFGTEIDKEKSQGLNDEKETIYRELYKPFIREVDGLKSVLKKLREK